jgi:hypothetical protein
LGEDCLPRRSAAEAGGKGNFATASNPSTKGEAVLSTINTFRLCMISQSATAPDKMRTNVKLAALMLVCLSAARQSSELLANAIIAKRVRMKSRVDFN